MTPIARLFKTFALTLGLLAGGLAGAAPTVTYSGGVAVGIQDVVVASTNYDVSFVFGSYEAVFASNAPTFLGNAADADAAAIALLAALDAETGATIGSGTGCCGLIWVPFADSFNGNSSMYWAFQIGYLDGGAGDEWKRYNAFADGKTEDRTGYNWGFAVFTADPGTVPEPGSLVLAGAALVGLGLASAKKAYRKGLNKQLVKGDRVAAQG